MTVPQDAPRAGDHERALSQRERDVLTFEGLRWRVPGSKERAIRARFDLTPTRYFQILNALLDSRAALEAEPVLVYRLRRLRQGAR